MAEPTQVRQLSLTEVDPTAKFELVLRNAASLQFVSKGGLPWADAVVDVQFSNDGVNPVAAIKPVQISEDGMALLGLDVCVCAFVHLVLTMPATSGFPVAVVTLAEA